MAEPIDKKHWGELEDEEFESEEEEEEEEGSEEEEEAEETPQPLVARPPQPAMDDGLETPTGIATPDHLVLRKKIDAPEEPRALYKASFPLLLSHSPFKCLTTFRYACRCYNKRKQLLDLLHLALPMHTLLGKRVRRRRKGKKQSTLSRARRQKKWTLR